MKNINFKINRDLHKRFKIAATNEEKSITEIMRILIDDFVKESENNFFRSA